MRNDRLLLISILSAVIAASAAYPEGLEIVLPRTWNGYIDDAATTHLAMPIIGCFDAARKFPRSNWKALFVCGSNSTFIEDIDLQIVRLHDFIGPSRMQIRYAGMPAKGPCTAACSCPVFFIANLHAIADSTVRASPATVYMDRTGRSKLNSPPFTTYTSMDLNSVKYSLSTDSDKKLQRVQLSMASFSQTLYFDPVAVQTKLVWAGDVNGDKKLDLLFCRPGRESFKDYELWFSTPADTPLVKLIDVFSYCGCR
jgi:hypothetical protein